MDSQPLSKEIYGAPLLENFKMSSLGKFKGISDPYEHIATINTQMKIIRNFDSLK